MSLIFGIFNRNGKPVEPEELETMYRAIAHFPHEKYKVEIIDNAAFGHMLTYNTPEALYENLPKWLPEQKLLFVMQGRLDNREELCEILNLKLIETLPDGDIILKAWLKWGKEAPDRLLGDWAFAVFNVETQELFIARDHHGYTAINYYIDKDTIFFSSSIKSLLALKQIPKILNQNKIIRTLVVWPGDDDQSYYQDIFILPPANTLKVNIERFEKKRYWFPENIETNYGKKQQDYADELLTILTKSIKDRLRSYKPIASMLSGGLDSGTVSYIAAELLKEKGKILTTYSHVTLYEPSNNIHKFRFGDEKPNMQATVNASGNINPVYLDSKDISPLDGILQFIGLDIGPIHAACNAYWLLDVISSPARDGFGALLTGEHGNATISVVGLDYHLPWKQIYQGKGLITAIRQKILRPIAYNHLGFISNRLKKSRGYSFYDYSLINPDFANKINLVKLMEQAGHDHTFSFNFDSLKDYLLNILQPGANLRCYVGSSLAQSLGIELRDPTGDKRVIDYALSIPNEMVFNEKFENKQIIKKMMNKKLPDKVLYAKAVGLQSSDIGARVMAQKDRIDKFINEVIKTDAVKEMIDTEKVIMDLSKIKNTTENNYDTTQIHHLLRTVMVGHFMNMF